MDTTLPNLMKQARGEKTQQEFADRFKVSRQLVYLWEHGLSTPSEAILSELGIVKAYSVRQPFPGAVHPAKPFACYPAGGLRDAFAEPTPERKTEMDPEYAQ